jgi:FKBP-type peptidyl-prolyl cis-trans isomerase
MIMLFAAFAIAGCSNKAERKQGQSIRQKQTTEQLEQVNKVLAEKDQETIGQFLKRRNMSMEQTATGLWYRIIEHNPGSEKVTANKQVLYGYHTRLLDGTLCYSSDESGPRKVDMASAQIVPGVKEALLLLHEGDSAQFILPPHLAYGLVGDQKRVPARAILFYDIRVKQVAP